MRKLQILFCVLLPLTLILGCAGLGGRNREVQLDTEIVIIGAGGAGFAAALEARQAGRDVIILEKNLFTGGNTGVAGSAANAPNMEMIRRLGLTIEPGEIAFIERMINLPPQNAIMAGWQNTLRGEWQAHRAGPERDLLFDSPSLHSLQTYYGGDFLANPVFVDMLGREALATLQWLDSLGGGWRTELLAAIGATWRRSHTPDFTWGTQGANFFMPVEAAFERAGGRVYTGHRAETIIMENGRAVGVSGVTNTGVPFTVRASRAVMLATGGFGANFEMLNYYNRHWAANLEEIGTTNLPTALGDGIVMGARAGANLIGMEWIQLVTSPGGIAPGGAITNLIAVNMDGNRFIREDARRDDFAAAFLEQPYRLVIGISDGWTIDDLMGGVHPDGSSIREVAAALEASPNPSRWIADTIEELAQKINVPVANLWASIDTFNAAARGIAPCPLGREVFQHPLDRPPFLASLAWTRIHHTMGGIEINERTQVLNTSGNIIPGLYAAGEVVGGVHGTNRLGANAITDILIFGRIAGRTMAAAN